MAFVLLNDEELDELISNADSLNTKKQIAYGVGRLRKYAEFAETTFEAVEAMSDEEQVSVALLCWFEESRRQSVHEEINVGHKIQTASSL